MKRLLGAAGVVLACAGAASGHEGATGIVKQRMDDMEHMARAVKRINERLKSGRGLAEIARDAEEIRAAAARTPSLYPPGNHDGHTDATAAVWQKWPEFVRASQLLEGEAEKLAAAARVGEAAAIAPQFRAMTRTCGGCHEVFRAKP